MKRTLWMLAVIAAIGCNRAATDETKVDNPEPGAGSVPADNTGRNERDQAKADPTTPGDQAENEVDRTITQQIRQDVVKDDALSMTGKNVKIITVDGVVTLRGPVENEKERSSIATIVKRVDGVKRVDNQLEIAAK